MVRKGARVNAKHLGWAKTALENYCLIRASGKMRDILRHKPEPKAFDPNDRPYNYEESLQPIPREEAPPVDYAIKDYWLVTLEWARNTKTNPHNRQLLDLVMFLYGAEKGRVEDFMVQVPFTSRREALGVLRLDKGAKAELEAFIETIAKVKYEQEREREKKEQKIA
jgi:hypothetical protein